MPDSGKQRCPLEEAYAFATKHGLGSHTGNVEKMAQGYKINGHISSSIVRRGYLIELFLKHNLLNEFKAEYWVYGTTPKGDTELNSCLRTYAAWCQETGRTGLL